MSLGEVVVILVVVGLIVLVALATLPRQREKARMAGCQRNLMQIGVGLAFYARGEGRFPSVAPLDTATPGTAPLDAILRTLQLPSLAELSDPTTPPKPQPGTVPGEQPVLGFTCPSDQLTGARLHPAPIAYRATAGEGVDGGNGGFAPGKGRRPADIDDGDGLSYTAAFAERRLGTGHPEASPANYRRINGRISPEGCPTAMATGWQGDAGSSWVQLGWASTLYNHSQPPNAAASCIASDGIQAHMGASSVHPTGVNVLMFDGSVRTVTPTVAPPIWRGMATISSPTTTPAGP